MGLTFTDADENGYVFTVDLYLDGATCDAFAALVAGSSNSDYTDWMNTILFILKGTEKGNPVTFCCLVTIDDDGAWHWAVTEATEAPAETEPG